MRGPHTTVQTITLSIFLGTALVAEGATLYWGGNPATRLGLGLVLVAVIMWLSARLGVVSRIAGSVTRFKRRRFNQLRSHVEELLREVRRLNWMAAGAERGFRTPGIAKQEIDALENRLHDIVRAIRTSAGRASPDAEAPEEPEVVHR